MELLEKYARESEKAEEKNKDKHIVSDDTFAVVEFISGLIDKIEHTRVSLIR